MGATPPGVEIPRSAADSSASPQSFRPGNQPIVPEGADPKWRFMWRIGPRPANTSFPEMNAAPVIPKGVHCFVVAGFPFPFSLPLGSGGVGGRVGGEFGACLPASVEVCMAVSLLFCL